MFIIGPMTNRNVLLSSLAYFMEKLERRLKLEVFLRQLENDSDRDVRESTNVSISGDDSQMDETLETNRTSYLDETIECEPSSNVPEVVVVMDEDAEAGEGEVEAAQEIRGASGSAEVEEDNKENETPEEAQRP